MVENVVVFTALTDMVTEGVSSSEERRDSAEGKRVKQIDPPWSPVLFIGAGEGPC